MKRCDLMRAIAVATTFVLITIPSLGQSPELRVAAAADLTKAFTDMAKAYEQETGQNVALSFGASGLLTRQIENAAPFDVFAAANVSYIDELDTRQLLLPETRCIYAEGHIGLYSRKGGLPIPNRLEGLTDPKYTKIAIANPKVAPYGRAAEEALESVKIWDHIQPRLVFGENVQQTFQFVQTGNADIALVPISLGKEGGGRFVPIPDRLYHPLLQAMAALKTTAHPEAAKRFIAFVSGPKGAAILKKYGFTLPAKARDKQSEASPGSKFATAHP